MSETTQGPQSSTPETSQTNAATPASSATPAPLAAPVLAAQFVNTLSKILPYMGTSVQFPTSSATVGTGRLEGVTYAGPITIPSTISAGVATPVAAGLPRSILAGYIRIKAFGAGTLTNITVTGSDGTNTEILFNEPAGGTLTATTVMTKLIPFECELNNTSFIVTLAGATGATVSIEINGSTGY